MDQYMDPKMYENMIQALQTFATQTAQATENLRGVSAKCKQVLGENDLVATKMDPYVNDIAKHYDAAGQEARRIIGLMQQELDEHYEKIKRELENQDSE